MIQDAIDALVRARTAAEAFAGVVRIDRGPTTILEAGYGLADRTWGIPCTLETRFDTASITKLFTAVATLQQIEAGAFALDTSVTGYLDVTPTNVSPEVTPYHLLTHTSGIADDADEEAGESYEALFTTHPNYAIRQTADFWSHIGTRPANFAPGEGCRYCNVSYILLGMMVERATGTTYRDYVLDAVFARSGMTHSGFFSMDLVEPDVAQGAEPVHGDDGTITSWRRNIYSYPPIGSPDGGAHVTAGDLFTFFSALRDGLLLGPEQTQAMLRPWEDLEPRGTGMHKMGFGFEFETDSAGTVISMWKEGINPGVSGVLCHAPLQDITYVVLSTLEDGAWDIITAIDEQIAIT